MRIVTTIILGITATFSMAQCACCKEENRQFDFWLGSWEVVNDTATLGYSSITLKQDSCIIEENWESNGGGYTGSSFNFWDPADSTWNQSWIDNQGGVLKLKGGWNGESMVLESELDPATGYFNRIVWTPNMDGTVRQTWHILPESGLDGYVAFDGLYKPKEN